MRLIRADARALPIRAGSVQCVVTSPPYWGLRDYGTATWNGGDTGCAHRIGRTMSNGNKGNVRDVLDGDRSRCQCGAQRIDRQLGLERTPEAYVSGLVEVFRQVWRVLKDDGVLWLNLGDSYANDTKWGGRTSGMHVPALHGGVCGGQRFKRNTGMKPKDLVGIPWRVAFALQAAGWYLRSDVIWSKPNPMPESVTDRPTKAHEYVFLLTKSERYHWNAEAIAEPLSWPDGPYGGRTPRAGIDVRGGGQADTNGFRSYIVKGTRNMRSVWTIPTQPYSGAHFATMPERLIERCVLAASRPGDLVCDPFVGSGTVARVAISLGRRAVGCDLQASYLELARERVQVTAGLPLEFEYASGHSAGAKAQKDPGARDIQGGG